MIRFSEQFRRNNCFPSHDHAIPSNHGQYFWKRMVLPAWYLREKSLTACLKSSELLQFNSLLSFFIILSSSSVIKSCTCLQNLDDRDMFSYSGEIIFNSSHSRDRIARKISYIFLLFADWDNRLSQSRSLLKKRFLELKLALDLLQ